MNTRTFIFIAILSALPFVSHAQGTDFVPLTKLPGLDELSKSDSLAPFLSQVYKMCIGIAAVLAVLQLMHAGILYMGGDSVTEKKQAKDLIGTTLAGLLLVLSPVIVFNIINPDILKLDLTSVKELTPKSTGASTDTSNSTGGANDGKAPGCTTPIANGQVLQGTDQEISQQETCCSAQTSAVLECHVQIPTDTTNPQKICSCTQRPSTENPGAASANTTQEPPPPAPATSPQTTSDQLNQGPYSTQTEAARAALTYSNPRSIKDNLEYGGVIYRDENGQYWFSGPIRGTPAGVRPYQATIPSGTQDVGNYHTHGDYSVVGPDNTTTVRTGDARKDDYNSDTFSDPDYQMITRVGEGIEGYRGYLGTPSGKFLYFDPKTKTKGTL
ncbi:MAG: DUF4329 domain-containing protein [Bacillota bacterium]